MFKQLSKIKENWLLILLVIIIVGAMNFFPANISSGNFGESLVASRAAYDSAGFAHETEERIVTKQAQLTVKSSDESRVNSLISENNALILNENKRQYSTSYSIKVPTSNYQSLLESFKSLGEVEFLLESKDDITKQTLDLQTQLSLEKQRLNNYQSILTEAKTAQEKLEVSDRIFNLERNIRYLEESLKNLNERVSYSTINLTLHKPQYEFINLSDMLKSLINSINTLIKLIIITLPWLIIFYVIYRLVKKFR